MANKEEILIQVKANLAGFKKSMDQLKKVADDAIKDIEKLMAMDLNDEGTRSGKSFARGFKNQAKDVTKSINDAIDNADAEVDVKINADMSGVSKIKSALGGLSGSVDVDVNTGSATSKMDSFSNMFSASMMGSAAGAMKNSINGFAGSMSGVSSTISATYERIKDVANSMTAVNTSAATYAKYVGFGEKAIERLNAGLKKMNTITALSEDEMNELARTAAIVENELSNIYNGDLLSNFKNAGIDTSSLEVVFDQVKDIKTAFDQLYDSMNHNANAPNKIAKSMGGLKSAVNGVNYAASKGATDVDRMQRKFKELANTIKGKVVSGLKKLKTKLLNIAGNVTGLNKVANAIRNIGKSAGDASSKAGKLGSTLGGIKGKIAALLSALGLWQMGSLFVEGTKGAIQFEAGMANIQRMLGAAAQSLIDFANTNAVSFGISKQQVAEYGNIFSVITSQFANTKQEVANLSQGLLECGGVIANALGRDVGEVLESLRSGILGSAEAVDQLGLNLKISNLEMSESFKLIGQGAESWNDLTAAQQQAIITQEILNQTQAIYGGLTTNVASAQNVFKAQLENTKLAIGNVGQVIWAKLLPPLTQFLAVIEKAANALANFLATLFGVDISVKSATKAASGIGDAAGGIKDATDGISSNSGKINDALNSIKDSTSGVTDSLSGAKDATDSMGEGAKDAAEKTEEAAKKIKKSLAGFDQINLLSLPEDEEKKDEDGGGKDPSDGGGGKDPSGGGGKDPSDIKIPTLDVPQFEIPPGLDGELIGDTEVEIDTSKWEAMAEKLKQIIQAIIEPLKEAWDGLKDRWMKAWEELKASFKNFCDALVDLIASLWEHGLREFIKHLGELVIAIGIAAMEIGGTLLDAFAELLRYLDPEGNEHMQRFLDTLNEVIVKLIALILDLNSHLESLLENGGMDVLKALADMFLDLGTAALKGIGVVIDAIDGLLDHLDPAVNEITRRMLATWEEAFRSIGEAAIAFAELLESTLVNGGQDVINALGDLFIEIVALWGTIADEAADAFAELFRHMDPANNEHAAGALEGFKYLVESIRGFVETLGKSLSTFMDNGGRAFINNVGDIIAILIDLGSTIAGDIIDAVKRFIDSWVGQAIIAAFAKALELLSAALEKLLEILEPLTPIISGVIAGILAFKGAIVVTETITFLVESFKSLHLLLPILQGSLTTLWGVLSANPIALVVAAIVGIGVALVAAYNKCEWFRDGVNAIFEKIKPIFESVKEAVVKAWDTISEKTSEVYEQHFKPLVDKFIEFGKTVGDCFKQLWDDKIKPVWDALKPFFSWLIDTFIAITCDRIGLLGQAFEIVCDLVANSVGVILDVLGSLLDILGGIIKFITGVFTGDWELAWEGLCDVVSGFKDAVVTIFTGLWENIKIVFGPVIDWFGELFSGAWEAVKSAWNGAGDWFGGVWEGIKGAFSAVGSWFGDIFSGAWEGIKSAWNGAGDWFGDVWEGIKDAFSAVGSWFGEKFSEGWEGTKRSWEGSKVHFEQVWTLIKGAFLGVGSWFGEKFSEGWEGVKRSWEGAKVHFEQVWTLIKGVFLGVGSWFKEKFSEGWEGVKSAWNGAGDWFGGVWEGIKGAFNDTTSWFGKLFSEAWEGVKDAWRGTKEFFSGIWEGIKSIFADIAGWFEGKFSDAVESTKKPWMKVEKFFEQVWTLIKGVFLGVASWFKEKFTEAWDAVKEACEKVTDIFGKVWEDIQKAFDKTVDWFKDLFSKTWEGVKTVSESSIKFFGNIWSDIKDAFSETKSWFKERFSEAWEGVKDAWSGTKEFFSGVWQGIKDVFEDISGWFKERFSDAWETIKSVWKDVTKFFSEIWKGIKDAFKDTKKYLSEQFNKAWDEIDKVWNKVVNYFEKIWSGIEKAFSKAADFLIKQFSKAWDDITKVWDKCTDFFQDIWDDLCDNCEKTSDFLIDAFDKAWEGITDIWDVVVDYFEKVWSGIEKAFSEAADYLSELFSKAWDNITKVWDKANDHFQKIRDGINETFEDAADWFGEKFSTAWDNIVKAWSKANDHFQGIRDGINKTFEDAADWFKEKFSTAWDNIETAWSKANSHFQKIRDEINKTFEDTSDWFKEKFSTAWSNIEKAWENSVNHFQELRQGIDDKFKDIGDYFKEKFGDAWTNSKDAFKDSAEHFKNVREQIDDKFKDIGDWFKTKFDDAWTKVKGAWTEGTVKTHFDKILSTVKSPFERDGGIASWFKTKFTDAFDAMLKPFKNTSSITNAFNTIKTTIDNAISKIKKIFTDFKVDWKIPKPKLPKISITIKYKTVGELSVPYPSFDVSWNALGGIFRRPTIFNTSAGLQGVGEAGAEAILPLNTLWKELNKSFNTQTQTLAAMMNNNSNNGVGTIELTLNIDGNKFGKACIDNINSVQRNAGRVMIDL